MTNLKKLATAKALFVLIATNPSAWAIEETQISDRFALVGVISESDSDQPSQDSAIVVIRDLLEDKSYTLKSGDLVPGSNGKWVSKVKRRQVVITDGYHMNHIEHYSDPKDDIEGEQDDWASKQSFEDLFDYINNQDPESDQVNHYIEPENYWMDDEGEHSRLSAEEHSQRGITSLEPQPQRVQVSDKTSLWIHNPRHEVNTSKDPVREGSEVKTQRQYQSYDDDEKF